MGFLSALAKPPTPPPTAPQGNVGSIAGVPGTSTAGGIGRLTQPAPEGGSSANAPVPSITPAGAYGGAQADSVVGTPGAYPGEPGGIGSTINAGANASTGTNGPLSAAIQGLRPTSGDAGPIDRIGSGGLLGRFVGQTGDDSSPAPGPVAQPSDSSSGMGGIGGFLQGMTPRDRTASALARIGGNYNSSPLNRAFQPVPSAPSAASGVLTGEATNEEDGFDPRSMQQFSRARVLGSSLPPQNTPVRRR